MLAALLLLAGLSASAESYPRINGVQIFVIDKEYNGDLGRFFAELRNEGYDAVFLRVFHNNIDRYHYNAENTDCTSGVYFNTGSACVVRDVLGEAVKAARTNNIKLYAWMATRTLSFLKTPEYMEKEFSGGTVKDGYGFSIFNEKASKTAVQLFRDLASYDIDGILFQDDFILRHREGASDSALSAYELSTGTRVTEEMLFGCKGGHKATKVPGGCEEQFKAWIKWKNESMMRFFGTLRTESMKINPNIRFAGNVYYETPLDNDKGMAWYAQSIPSMLDNGFDYLAVMGYHDQIAKELSLKTDESLNVLETMIKNLSYQVPEQSRILFKVQRISFEKDRKIEDADFRSVCTLLEKYPEISRVTVPVNHAGDVTGICTGK